jgi:cation transporter-like permease
MRHEKYALQVLVPAPASASANQAAVHAAATSTVQGSAAAELDGS